MPFYDKATQAALDRFNAQAGASHDLAAIQNDPSFQAMLQEENTKVASGNTKSPFSSTPCPLQVKKDNPNCTVTSLQIIKNKSRKHLVEIANNGSVLEVVGGNLEWLAEHMSIANFNPAKIEVIPQGAVLKGPCTSGSHKDKTFDVPQLKVKSKADTKLEFESFSDWAFLPWNATPRKYPIKYNTCTTSLRSEIHVYPDVEFGIGFEYKYQDEKGLKFTDRKLQLTDADRALKARHDALTAHIAEQEKVFKPNKTGRKQQQLENRAANEIRRSEKELKALESQPSKLGWEQSSVQKFKITESISLFGFYKFAGQEIELKHVLKNVIEKVQKVGAVVDKIQSIVKKIQDLDSQSDALAAASKSVADAKVTKAKTGFSITYPTVGMKMSGLWEELDGRPDCQYGAAIVFFAKPLIGIEFKYDITYAVLNGFGAFGKTIGEIKEYMEKRDITTVAIIVSVAGKFNFELRAEMNSATESNNVGAQIQVEVALKLEIKVVQFRKRVLKYDVVVDIGGSGESGFVVTAKINSKKINIDLEWTGVKATIISNTTVTKSTESSGDAPPKVTPYKGVKKELSKDVSETESEENEKTFKLKGEKFTNLYVHNFA